jgi:hypothetical protein
MSKLYILPCLDSEQMAASRRRELNIPRDVAAALGRSAVEAGREGCYVIKAGQKVEDCSSNFLIIGPPSLAKACRSSAIPHVFPTF